MDVTALIEACFNGLAKGGASALGSSLWTLTQKLISKISDKFSSAEEVSETDALIELSNPTQMAQEINELRDDSEFEQVVNAWERIADMYAHNNMEIDIKASGSNVVSGMTGSNINISQSIK